MIRRKIIKWAFLIFESRHVQYHLPYHKGDPFYQGTTIVCMQQEVADPVSLLQEYIISRDRLHGVKAALFLHENGFHPSCSWFESKFFAVLDHRFGGHSAWAGCATFLTSLGISETVIQAIGRWSSEAWKIYIRENPAIRVELQLAAIHLRQ
jgi:hypothetical protein